MIAPILPGISDGPGQLKDSVTAAVDAGATFVTPILLHLRPIVRDEYMGWLREHYPRLVASYEVMYRRAYAPKSDQNSLATTIGALITEAAPPEPARPRKENFRRVGSKRLPARAVEAEQMRLI
jgi:DNA repair photolyase